METPFFTKEKSSPIRDDKFGWLRPVNFTKVVKLFQDDKNRLIAIVSILLAAIIIVLLMVTHTPKFKFEYETSPNGSKKCRISMEK